MVVKVWFKVVFTVVGVVLMLGLVGYYRLVVVAAVVEVFFASDLGLVPRVVVVVVRIMDLGHYCCLR